MTSLVSYQFSQSVSTITMDDGKANVFSPAMLAELNGALDRAESDGGVVVIQGRDGLFSGGFDMGVFRSGDQEEIFTMLKGGAELTRRLLGFPQPTLAACTGHSIAMGLFVLLSCDFRIGAASGCFFAANEVAIGMTVPRFATAVCRQRLSPAAFNSGLCLAEFFDSGNAVAAGILDRVVQPDQLISAVTEKAQSFLKLDMESHRATKQRMRSELLAELEAAIAEDCAGWKERTKT